MSESRPSGLLRGHDDPGFREKLQALSRDLRAKYGMLDDPPKAPAGPPAVGEAAERHPPRRNDAATPGAPAAAPLGEGAPGPASPPLPVDRPGSGGEAPSSRPGRAAQDAASGTGSKAWQAEIARQNRAKRNRRGKRAAPPVTGIRWTPPPGGAA